MKRLDWRISVSPDILWSCEWEVLCASWGPCHCKKYVTFRKHSVITATRTAEPLDEGHTWGLILNCYPWALTALPFKGHRGVGVHVTRCWTSACVLNDNCFFQIILKNRVHLSRRQHKLTTSWILLTYRPGCYLLRLLPPQPNAQAEVGLTGQVKAPRKSHSYGLRTTA